jgi:hypothetical protein
LRSDVLAESAAFPTENRETLLHTLPKHCFLVTYEWKLHEVMVAEALKRNPRYQELEEEFKPWCDADQELEVETGPDKPWRTGERANLYRKIRWGQHKRQRINLNGMLKRLVSEAAEPNALKLARRFHPLVRQNVYRGAATSQRALQLLDVFPVLGLVIYCPSDHRLDRTADGSWARRRWKRRFSKRRSNTPQGQKNNCGCRRRRRRTVPDEDRGRGNRRLPLHEVGSFWEKENPAGPQVTAGVPGPVAFV